MTQVTDSDHAMVGYSSFDTDREERIELGRMVVHDRYRIVRLLGRGGVALVYEATDTRAGRNVALKVVTGKYADKSNTSDRYHNEARLAAAIGRHPNVVSPIEIGRIPEFHGRLYLATELVHGRCLGKVMLHHTRGLEILRVCKIGRDVARALYALHERGIVHRDIKPDNIMLELDDGSDEVAKLLDFGFAYALGKGKEDVQASPDLTQAHERPGTGIYMAPEQAIGLRPALAFDLYALGASLYEMLTGTAPYAGGSTIEVLQRKCALDDPPPAVERLRRGLPPQLASLVGQCLCREPGGRPTIKAALAKLEQLCEPDIETVGDAIASKRASRSTTSRTETADPRIQRELNAIQSGALDRLSNGGTAATATPSTRRGSTEGVGLLVPALPNAAPVTQLPAAQPPMASVQPGTPAGKNRKRTAVATLAVGLAGLATWVAWPTPTPPDSRQPTEAVTHVSSTGAEPDRADSTGAEPDRVDSTGAEPDRVDSTGAERGEVEAIPSDPDSTMGATPDQRAPVPPQPNPIKPPEPSPKQRKQVKAPVDCEAVLADAEQAVNSRSWALAYTLTSKRNRKCWRGNKAAYRRLRSEAAIETNHFSECVRVLTGAPDGKRLLRACEAEVELQ